MDAVLAAKTEEERAAVLDKKETHRAVVSVGRTRYGVREKLGVQHPEVFLVLSLDGMDTGKTYTPKEGAFLSCCHWIVFDAVGSILLMSQANAPTRKTAAGKPSRLVWLAHAWRIMASTASGCTRTLRWTVISPARF